MNVVNIKMCSLNNTNNNYKNNVCFMGTPNQILEALNSHGVSHEKGLCGDKANFIIEIVNFFAELQKQGISFIYKLGENNDIPSHINDIKVNGKTLEIWDSDLNDPNQRFKCSGGCHCGEGSTKGQYLINLFDFLKIPEPKEIKTLINN